MSNKDSRITYTKRCLNCNNDELYVMRDHNVNTGISNDDVVRMADEWLGHTASGHCESCKLFTQHQRIAYDLSTIMELSDVTE